MLYLKDSAETALTQAREALHLAESGQNPKEQTRAFRNMGLAKKILLSDYDKALEHCFRALRIAEDNNFLSEEAHTRSAIASIYQEVGNHYKSLEFYMQALALFKKQNESKSTILTLNNIGNVHAGLGQTDKAINYHRQALKAAEENRKPSLIAISKQNLALVYENNGQYNQALKHLEDALQVNRSLNKKNEIANVLREMGIINRLQGNYQEALNMFNRAKNIHQENQYLKDLGKTLNQIGLTYMEQDDYREAINFLKQGLDYAIETNDKKNIQLSYENLYNCYANLKAYERALRYKDLYIAISEFIYSEESEQQMAEMQTNYEIEKKENEIEVLRKDKRIQELALAKQKNLTYFLITIAVLLLVIAGLSFYAFRTKQKANKDLAKANADLQNLNATKDRFFSIIGHDLKGPLNSLTSFSHLLINHTDSLSKDEIRNLATDLDHSVKNLFTLLENLLEWARSQTGNIELNPEILVIGDLIANNQKLMQQTAENKSLTLKTDYPENLPVKADKNSINTVIRNLISNAIKFTEEGGTISVKAKDRGDKVEIAVSDNGVGMSPEVQNKLFRLDEKYSSKGTSNEKGTGLGLILCKDFVEMNGGTIEVESEEEKGTTFRFTLPK